MNKDPCLVPIVVAQLFNYPVKTFEDPKNKI